MHLIPPVPLPTQGYLLNSMLVKNDTCIVQNILMSKIIDTIIAFICKHFLQDMLKSSTHISLIFWLSAWIFISHITGNTDAKYQNDLLRSIEQIGNNNGISSYIRTDIQLNVICFLLRVSHGNSPECIVRRLFVLLWASHLIYQNLTTFYLERRIKVTTSNFPIKNKQYFTGQCGSTIRWVDLHICQLELQFYIEPLNVFGNIYCPDGLNNTLLSQDYTLENGSHCGNKGKNIYAKDEGGVRSLRMPGSIPWVNW